MAESIGPASGLLALAKFASQSSVTLNKTIQGFRHRPRRVRDLDEELEALSKVLRSLIEIIGAAPSIDLSVLNLPLLQCGNACQEFEQKIRNNLSRSSSSPTSFREWAKASYMGVDIDDFRQILGQYKSTFSIALMDANL